MDHRVSRLLLFKVGKLLIWITSIIIAIYFLFMPITGNLFSLSIKSEFDPKIIIGLTITELSKEEIGSIELEPWQRDYYQKFDVVPATVNLKIKNFVSEN